MTRKLVKMKKVYMICILLLGLTGCGGPGSDAAPGKISDIIPYDDKDAEIYNYMETVDLKALQVVDDLESAANKSGLQCLFPLWSGIRTPVTSLELLWKIGSGQTGNHRMFL